MRTANGPAASAAPPTGLPARSQLREQERLLSELLHASGRLARS